MYYVIHQIFSQAADRDFCEKTATDEVVIADAPAISNGQAPGESFGEPVVEGYSGVCGDWEFWGHGEYPSIEAAREHIHRTWPERNDVLPDNVRMDVMWQEWYVEKGVYADYR